MRTLSLVASGNTLQRRHLSTFKTTIGPYDSFVIQFLFFFSWGGANIVKMLFIMLIPLSSLPLCSECSTCLQCLHLLQRIHLLPQPVELGLDITFLCSCVSTGKGKKKQIRQTQVENSVLRNDVLCALLPPDWRGETAFLVWDGRLEPKWSNEKQRTRQTGRARRAMSGASGSYRTGHSGTPCTAMKRTKNTVRSSIYTGSLCVGLGTLPAMAPTLFLSKHQDEVREVKGWSDK